MRILHVVEAASTGVARHVLDLSEGALRAGHIPVVIYSPLREDNLFRAGNPLPSLDIGLGPVHLPTVPVPSAAVCSCIFAFRSR